MKKNVIIQFICVNDAERQPDMRADDRDRKERERERERRIGRENRPRRKERLLMKLTRVVSGSCADVTRTVRDEFPINPRYTHTPVMRISENIDAKSRTFIIRKLQPSTGFINTQKIIIEGRPSI